MLEFEAPGRLVVPSIFVNFMVRFRRRNTKYVAIRTARRRHTQAPTVAPTIPPSSLALIPGDDADIVAVFSEGFDVVTAATFAMGNGRGLGDSGVGVGGL